MANENALKPSNNQSRQNGLPIPSVPESFYFLAISIVKTSAILRFLLCRGGGTGRRAGFKIRFLHGSAGSIPALGTKLYLTVGFFLQEQRLYDSLAYFLTAFLTVLLASRAIQPSY
jgi:hypothetical protein